MAVLNSVKHRLIKNMSMKGYKPANTRDIDVICVSATIDVTNCASASFTYSVTLLSHLLM